MIDSTEIWKDAAAIRRHSPLVHNVTNLVVMDFTANALLALGASPVMAHAPQEVEEMPVELLQVFKILKLLQLLINKRY